jgi:hypothetical protein
LHHRAASIPRFAQRQRIRVIALLQELNQLDQEDVDYWQVGFLDVISWHE